MGRKKILHYRLLNPGEVVSEEAEYFETADEKPEWRSVVATGTTIPDAHIRVPVYEDDIYEMFLLTLDGEGRHIVMETVDVLRENRDPEFYDDGEEDEEDAEDAEDEEDEDEEDTAGPSEKA